MNKPHNNALAVKLLYHLDHVGSIAAKSVEFLHKNDITILHLHTQQIQPLTVGRAAGCLVGKDAVGFHSCIFKCLDLNIKGLLTC